MYEMVLANADVVVRLIDSFYLGYDIVVYTTKR
jgi:hypothetical protein